jgi:hypothetical protein
MRNRRVASTLTFIIDLVTFILARHLSSAIKYLLSILSSTRNPLLLPYIHIRAQAMAETMLPTPAASSSTSPTQLDSTDKKRPRESTASSVIQPPATKKAKADVTNGDSNIKETKGVFCHQSVQHTIRGREADSQMPQKG